MSRTRGLTAEQKTKERELMLEIAFTITQTVEAKLTSSQKDLLKTIRFLHQRAPRNIWDLDHADVRKDVQAIKHAYFLDLNKRNVASFELTCPATLFSMTAIAVIPIGSLVNIESIGQSAKPATASGNKK